MKEKKSFLKSILKGWIGAVLLTFVALLVLSLAMIKFELSDNVYSIIFVVISALSLVVGSVIAARTNEEKRWLIGAVVGVLFFIFMFVLDSVINGGFTFDVIQIYKLLICTVVGSIAGILGVNI